MSEKTRCPFCKNENLATIIEPIVEKGTTSWKHYLTCDRCHFTQGNWFDSEEEAKEAWKEACDGHKQ